MVRTLYDCYHARYPVNDGSYFQYVTCDRGHKLGNGYIHRQKVDRGDNLICRVCQLCTDHESMGEPYKKEDK